MAAKGEVSLTDAGIIQSAMRWERHAALSQRFLTVEHATLKPDQLLQFSREIAKASDERDKAIQSLGLDRDTVQDAWALLDSTPIGDLEDK